MDRYILGFEDIDKTKLMAVGGKGVNLGELSEIEGIQVPKGFCVTTEAYKKMIDGNKGFDTLLEQLSVLKPNDREKIRDICAKIRTLIEGWEIPRDIEEAVLSCFSKFGEEKAYAVRSSATAEDLPLASFAGQQDTFLNIKGKGSILKHISKCWASLFTDRAVVYRMQNGFDHRKVFLSVVIQEMVYPQSSGIMFTADPVTSNRKVLSIDAGFGLGEALVSGLVNPDIYKVREGKIIDKKISAKKRAIYALKEGSTQEREVGPELQRTQTLTDQQILELEKIGRQIETHFNSPQDIEWCLAEGSFYVVQSRPITTLFPVPEERDEKNHVYMSLGHPQMMTDAMKPLGLSFFGFLSKEYPLSIAGGRLFMDLTYDLASPLGRKLAVAAAGQSDPLMRSAVLSLMKRKDFIKSLPRGKRAFSLRREGLSWRIFPCAYKIYRENDPGIIPKLISQNQASVKELERRITGLSGEELFDFIVEDQRQLMKLMYDPLNYGVIVAALYAFYWIDKKMEKWLGEKNVGDILSKSVPNNVTSEMGLELLDVADVVRKYPEVMEYFDHPREETFFEDLLELEGGKAVSSALREYLKKYGMRCPGEIDITRTRWSERPTVLVPMIMNNIQNFEPGAGKRKFQLGWQEALQKEEELLCRLKQLPGGNRKAKKAKKMFSVLRNFIGYREYPKYGYIRRYFIYKQAILKEAALLVEKGLIKEKEDVYFLSLEEFREAAAANKLDYGIITRRKEEFAVFEKLTPPRIMTSEGEIINGEYNTGNIPPGALPGVPVSAGVFEGRARVVLSIEDADIQEGDILVTVFTDPSWTPMFVSVKGLVTEVGGPMTHGAVIAREYGLPAVVAVENATKLIKDGQKLRVNGTEGFVEILE